MAPSKSKLESAPVLVIGAGPVGLTAATWLKHLGAPVQIVDASAAATHLSKALVVWRRTLHTLDPVLPHEELLKRGTHLRRFRAGDAGRCIAQLTLSPPDPAPADPESGAGAAHGLPPGVLLSQAAMEEALESNLRDRYATRVGRATRLTALRAAPDGAGVIATLSDAAGREREVAAPYLIAADGAHSAVRHALGVQLVGVTLAQRWRFLDVRYEPAPGLNPNRARDPSDRVFEEDGAMVMTTAAGTLGFVPIARHKGVVRVVWNYLSGKAAVAVDAPGGAPPPPPTLEEVQVLLLRHTLLDMRLTEILWVGEFAINERQAESYVTNNGRVFLAGDAAHVHSPAGGQGMNLGIQDAANLAWKVALALAGEAAAPGALLASYQDERWLLGRQVIKTSGTLLRLNTMRNPFLRALRRAAISAAFSIRAVRRGAVATLAQDVMAYPDSPLTAAGPAPSRRPPRRAVSEQERFIWGAARPGTAFPDVHVSIAGAARPATDLLRGPVGGFGSLVLLMPRTGRVGAAASAGAGGGDAAWPVNWGPRALRVLRVALRPAAQQGSESDAAPDATKGDAPADADDSWGLLAAAFGVGPRQRRRRAGALGVLVRPDGYIAVMGGPDAIHGWLAKHVAPGP